MRESIEIHPELEPVEAEWEELALELGSPPFLRPGWFSCWLGAFGSTGLQVIALRRDGRLAAVVPTLSRHGVVRSPTDWSTPIFGPVAVDTEAELALFPSFFRERPRRVDLSFLTPATAEHLRGASGTRSFVQRVLAPSPYLEIEQDWESYWAGLSGNLRSNVRRRRRRLAELGEVAVEVVEGGERLPALLQECFEIEYRSWKRELGTAVLSSQSTVRFYDRLAEWAAGAGLMRLALLRLDGRIIAFNYCLEAGGRHYLLRLGYEPELGEMSPGTVLTAAMVERAFSFGLKSYEFLGAADHYKLRWTKTLRNPLRVQSFARSPLGAMDRIVQTHGRAAGKRLRTYVGRAH